MRLLLAGGTGLIGGEVPSLGLKNGHEITTVGRRPTGMASREIVSSFGDIPRLPPANIAICALGTTIRQAGTKAAFRAIDEKAVVTFATAAKAAGVDHFPVVTAVGAHPDALVFLFPCERPNGRPTNDDGLLTARHHSAGAAARRQKGASANRSASAAHRPCHRSTDAWQMAPL